MHVPIDISTHYPAFYIARLLWQTTTLMLVAQVERQSVPFFDGLWCELARMQTHNLLHEMQTCLPLKHPNSVTMIREVCSTKTFYPSQLSARLTSLSSDYLEVLNAIIKHETIHHSYQSVYNNCWHIHLAKLSYFHCVCGSYRMLM